MQLCVCVAHGQKEDNHYGMIDNCHWLRVSCQLTLSASEQSNLITPSLKYSVRGKSFRGLEKGVIFLCFFFLRFELSPVDLCSVRVVVVIMLCFDRRHHHLISTPVCLTCVILLV